MSAPAELASLADLIAGSPPRCGRFRVVAVDGGAAAGKSSLAGQLAERLPGSSVLHLDELLEGWSDQFGFAARLRAGVLEPLAAGRPASYRRYDWTAGRLAETVPVSVSETLIVEGVSAIDGCAGWSSVAIYLDLPRPDRERRWIERDGPLQPEWLAWLDREDRYFAEHPLPAGTLILHR